MTPPRQRMSEDMQVRTYLQYASQFARYFGKSPALLRPAEMRSLLYLTRDSRLRPAQFLCGGSRYPLSLSKVTLQRGWTTRASV